MCMRKWIVYERWSQVDRIDEAESICMIKISD